MDSDESSDVPRLLGATNIPVIRESMQSVRRGFHDEHKRLELNWAEYYKLKESIDRLHERIASAAVLESDRLKLNVGGKRFEIRESTVKNNGFIRSLLNNVTFTPPDRDGYYFINRDPDYIPVIMRYLRNGRVTLSRYTNMELRLIREDAEFFMMHDFVSEIDVFMQDRQAPLGRELWVPSEPIPTDGCELVTGIFFELDVRVAELRLNAIGFLAGERRKIVSEVYYREGGIDATGQLVRIGNSEQQAAKRDMVMVSLTKPLIMARGLHTLGLYSSSCLTAITVLRRQAPSIAPFQCDAFAMKQTYHTTNVKGLYNQRADTNVYDYCGKLVVALQV